MIDVPLSFEGARMVHGTQPPDDVARDMWHLYSEAKAALRRTREKTNDEQQAMQTVALTAMAAMQAEEADYY